jgi:hypothetical protein
MPRRPAILALLLPLLLAGCRRPAGEVLVAPRVPFRLCPPEAGPDLFVTQEVVFHLPGGRRETALAVIENGGGTLSLVASTPMGQTLFVVRLRGTVATVDARAPLPGGLDPRALAALVEFALWPAEAVGRNLAPGIRFEQDGARRTLLRDGKVAWTVIRDGEAPPYSRMELVNPDLGLDVDIRTVTE